MPSVVSRGSLQQEQRGGDLAGSSCARPVSLLSVPRDGTLCLRHTWSRFVSHITTFSFPVQQMWTLLAPCPVWVARILSCWREMLPWPQPCA